MMIWRWCWAPGRSQRWAWRSLSWAAPGIAGRWRRTRRRLQSFLLGQKKLNQGRCQMLQNQNLLSLFFKAHIYHQSFAKFCPIEWRNPGTVGPALWVCAELWPFSVSTTPGWKPPAPSSSAPAFKGIVEDLGRFAYIAILATIIWNGYFPLVSGEMGSSEV